MDTWIARDKPATDTYNRAKSFLMIRACVNVVQMKSGDAQVSAAEALLAKRDTLPAAMVKALENCKLSKGGSVQLGVRKRERHDDIDVGSASAREPSQASSSKKRAGPRR